MYIRYLLGLNVLKFYKIIDFYKLLLLLYFCVYRGNRMVKGLCIFLLVNRIYIKFL